MFKFFKVYIIFVLLIFSYSLKGQMLSEDKLLELDSLCASEDTISINIYRKALKFYEGNNLNYKIAECYKRLGLIYDELNNYDSAMFFYLKALEKNKIINNKEEEANIYNAIGNIYFNRFFFEKALINYHQSISINESLGNKRGIARNLGNIGNVFYYQKDYNKAVVYYTKALKMQQIIKDEKGISKSYINIANIYSSYLNDFQKALYNYEKALEIQQAQQDSKGIAFSYNNLGILYQNNGKYAEAFTYYQKALSFNKKNKDSLGMAYNYIGIADVKKELAVSEECLFYTNKGMSIAKKTNNLYLQERGYNILSDLYIKQKEYIKGISYKDSVLIINDKIYNKEKAKAIAQLQIKYQVEKKEKRIIEQQYEIDKQKLQKNVIIMFFFSLFIIVITVYRSRKLLKNKNKKLTELLESINIKNKTIKENEELLNKTADAAKDAVILIDNEGKIVLWNQSAEKMFGYSMKQAKGKEIHNLITPYQYREKAHHAFSIYKQTGKGSILNKTIEIEGMKNGGSIFPIELSLSSVLIKQKLHSIGIIRDITERKKNEKIIKESRLKLETLYKDITDNINYAKIIQQSLLPSRNMLNELLPEYFLFYLPKEIIGGDFYFTRKINDKLIFAVADCTGHGVSGALLSILGITLLHEIIKEQQSPSDILTDLRSRIIDLFEAFDSNNKNGLDIALCVIDTKTGVLRYSGAFSSLYIIRQKVLTEYKAVRNPIGFYYGKSAFEEIEIKLHKNDLIYLFSDGYIDQFGGAKKKKFMQKRFKQLLIDNSMKSIIEQKEIIKTTFFAWKDSLEQVDDITILCVKYDNIG